MATAKQTSIIGIHHLGLTVANIKAAANFYADAAQLKPDISDAEIAIPLLPGTNASAMLSGPNARLRLLQKATTSLASAQKVLRPVSKSGITHFCMQAPEIDAIYNDFARAGATFHSNPVDLGTGFLYCYSRDPEANVVELEGVPRLWDDARPWFAHVSISTPDIERSSNFYSAALNNKAIRSPHLGPNSRMDQVAGLKNVELKAAWIPTENIQIEVMQYFQPPSMPETPVTLESATGYCYICFEVTDAHDALADLISLGATQSPALAALSALHGGQYIFCADPDGNIILLLAIKPEEENFSTAKLQDPYIVSRMAKMRSLNTQKLNTQKQNAQEQNQRKAS